MVEYLSGWDEKWMIKQMKLSSFTTHFTHVSTKSIYGYFRQFSVSGTFLEIGEIYENSEKVVSETLFSESNLWANICRIDMKSTWSDSLDSEVFEQCDSSYVGPFAPDQRPNLIEKSV